MGYTIMGNHYQENEKQKLMIKGDIVTIQPKYDLTIVGI